MEKSVFQILNEYDITEHLKKKDRIIYLPWSKAWMIVKSLFPSAKFTINKAADGCIYHTDGKTAWVEVSITINDQTETESLAVMDFRNKCLQKRFGVIEGITDKGYITNSYHVHVTEHINAFDKLRFESQFQKLSPGGAISYIEVANLSDNIPAVLTVLKYIYDNIMYAELNTKSDYCQVCGWDKEIEIVDDDRGKLIWKCPNCGNTDKSKMNIARRTCGYIGLNDWNQGRTQEIKERYVHLGGDE